jgi:hypothetical protein
MLRIRLAFTSLLLLIPVAGYGQTIQGTLVDAQAREAVPAATVELLDSDSVSLASVVTNDQGEFRIAVPGPGAYHLRASRVGFATTISPAMELSDDDTVEIEFRVPIDAVALAPIDVIAYSRRPTGPLGGFYERMDRAAFGTFIDRERIERSPATFASDLLLTVPGVQVYRAGFGQTVLVMRGTCIPQLYLDGVPIRGASIDDLVHPTRIEGIEIYRGPAGAPIEFAGGAGSCGVVAVWTRRG